MYSFTLLSYLSQKSSKPLGIIMAQALTLAMIRLPLLRGMGKFYPSLPEVIFTRMGRESLSFHWLIETGGTQFIFGRTISVNDNLMTKALSRWQF